MGWKVYECPKGRKFRHAGYGVPAYCDHPDCDKEIDRGLSHICGQINKAEERGCGLHFCETHLGYSPRYGNLCERCYPRQKEPFPAKPEHPEWAAHVLADDSWQAWREENPQWVDALKRIAKENEQ